MRCLRRSAFVGWNVQLLANHTKQVSKQQNFASYLTQATVLALQRYRFDSANVLSRDFAFPFKTMDDFLNGFPQAALILFLLHTVIIVKASSIQLPPSPTSAQVNLWRLRKRNATYFGQIRTIRRPLRKQNLSFRRDFPTSGVSSNLNMLWRWKRIARWTSVCPTSNADGRLRRWISSAVSVRAMLPPWLRYASTASALPSTTPKNAAWIGRYCLKCLVTNQKKKSSCLPSSGARH